jgi:hypothetical protein
LNIRARPFPGSNILDPITQEFNRAQQVRGGGGSCEPSKPRPDFLGATVKLSQLNRRLDHVESHDQQQRLQGPYALHASGQVQGVEKDDGEVGFLWQHVFFGRKDARVGVFQHQIDERKQQNRRLLPLRVDGGLKQHLESWVRGHHHEIHRLEIVVLHELCLASPNLPNSAAPDDRPKDHRHREE